MSAEISFEFLSSVNRLRLTHETTVPYEDPSDASIFLVNGLAWGGHLNNPRYKSICC